MGTSSLAGSFIGGYGSHLLPENGINIIYGLMAVTAAIMMMLPKKEKEKASGAEVLFNKKLAGILAFVTGVFAGIVGAGAFILVPIMLVVLKIPIRMTIATSLGITFLSSIGSVIGKMATGQILYHPAVVMLIVSLIAAPLGVKAGKKMNSKVLQYILAVLIIATALKIWIDLLMT